MTRHVLKIHPDPFNNVLVGLKTYEVRSEADRRFAVGDVLDLCEWDPKRGDFTGQQVTVVVRHKTAGGNYGLPVDLCVLGIEVAP